MAKPPLLTTDEDTHAADVRRQDIYDAGHQLGAGGIGVAGVLATAAYLHSWTWWLLVLLGAIGVSAAEAAWDLVAALLRTAPRGGAGEGQD
ncbi:hypothetical protein ACFWY9_16540 [Amycolatopsis sp. NPDC059027]|uniref:hypothetical protein n=1 Tax=Amycolatopsis sp. NPDC059027 TaxID=3346709 RepID=UPI00366FFEDB